MAYVSSLMAKLEAMPGSRKAALAWCVLLALTLAAYSNSFDAGFQFDDFHQIVRNQNMRDLTNVPRFFVDAGLGSATAGLKGYRPVTFSSFALNHALSGYAVWSYHLFNFLLHVINAFLVFMVVGAVMREAGSDGTLPIALLASLVFALHPIQTDAVTYISGRAVLLASAFYLLAFYGFIRFRAGGGWLWALSTPAFFCIGLLSKETTVSLLAVLVAYDLIIVYPKRGGIRKSAAAALYYIPFIASLAAYLVVRRHLSGYFVEPEWTHGAGEYLMSEAKALLLYARLMSLPINLNADYDLPVTGSVDALVVISALLLAASVFMLYRLRAKKPAAAFFGLWFLIALAPESSIIPITDIAVEYRLYLPSVGLIAALATLLSGLEFRPRRLRMPAAALLLVLLGILTFSRNAVWADEYTLWSDAAGKAPYSARTHANLGSALMFRKDFLGAIAEFNRSLDINPFYNESYNVYNNLGICLFEAGMKEDALMAYGRAIAVYPGYMDGYRNLAASYFRMGRYKEAVDVLEKARRIDPEYGPAHLVLARSYAKLGRDKEALSEAEAAAGYSPGDFETRYNLAAIYSNNAMSGKAMAEARTALGLAADEGQRKDAEGLMDELQGGRYSKGMGGR